MCGRGQRDGVEIHADHIIPKDRGGESKIENGQTLCAPHNSRKKKLKETESGRQMFIELYQLSKLHGDNEMRDFCRKILEVFEKHNVNDYIEWKR